MFQLAFDQVVHFFCAHGDMVKSAHFPMFLYVSHIPIGHSHGGKVMCLLRFLTWGRALKGHLFTGGHCGKRRHQKLDQHVSEPQLRRAKAAEGRWRGFPGGCETITFE